MTQLTSDVRKLLKAKAYIQDILSGLVPSDPEFNEIWDLLDDAMLRKIDITPNQHADDILSLADKIRAIRNRHIDSILDKFQG